MIEEIIRIKYADTYLAESQIFEGGSRDKQFPIIFSFFLIITTDKRILVDTGCEEMEGFVLENLKHPVKALKDCGYRPDDITDIIITHAHHDHIGCVGSFLNATVYIQKDEYLNGKSYLLNCRDICLFDDSVDISSVRAVKIGGHSVGSCVVECPVCDKVYVICGDECYARYNLIHKLPTAASYNKDKSSEFIVKYLQEPYICLLSHEE